MTIPTSLIYTPNLIFFVNCFSSGVVWEMKPKQKWKPFSQKQIMLLEQSYKKYQVSKDHGWIKLDNNFEVYQNFFVLVSIYVFCWQIISKENLSKSMCAGTNLFISK